MSLAKKYDEPAKMKVTIRKIFCFIIILAFNADVTVLGAHTYVELAGIRHLHYSNYAFADGAKATSDMPACEIHTGTRAPSYRKPICPYRSVIEFNFETIFFEEEPQEDDCKFINKERISTHYDPFAGYTILSGIKNIISPHIPIYLQNSSFIC